MDVFVSLTNVPQILLTWSVYFGAGALFLVVAVLAKRPSFSVREFLSERFPFNLLASNSARLDVKVYVIGKLTDVFWAAPGGFLSAALPLTVLAAMGEREPASGAASGLVALTIVGIALFLTIELADFTMHYGEHKIPVLWELHKVHHSADSLNPLTSKRGHPVSLVLMGVARAMFFCVPAGLAMHFVGLSLVEVVAARVLVMKTCTILTLDPLRHSPFPVNFGWLDRIFISPHMHQVHHSSLKPHWDRNFGTNISMFDWIFGTGYKPVSGEPIELGLYGYDATRLAGYHTIYGTYVSPLANAWSKIPRPRTAGEAGAPEAQGAMMPK